MQVSTRSTGLFERDVRRPGGGCRARPLFLASVRSVTEAEMALTGGADLIDCKDPDAGALGALDPSIVARIAAAVGGRVPVSATVGDVWDDPFAVRGAVERLARTGVEIVKVGVIDGGLADKVLRAARDAVDRLGQQHLVAVLLVDHGYSPALLNACAEAGVDGVMLDTSAKGSGGLMSCLDTETMADFVSAAREKRLACGLAGGLGACDVRGLAALGPDILGFRGGLCAGGERRQALDVQAIDAVRRAFDECFTPDRAGREIDVLRETAEETSL